MRRGGEARPRGAGCRALARTLRDRVFALVARYSADLGAELDGRLRDELWILRHLELEACARASEVGG